MYRVMFAVFFVMIVLCSFEGARSGTRSGVSREYRTACGETFEIGFSNHIMYAGFSSDSTFSLGYYQYGNAFYPVTTRHLTVNNRHYTVVSVTRDSLILLKE